MSSGNSSNNNSKSWVQIVIAVISAIALIAVAYLQFKPPEGDPNKKFTGRVIEAKTEKRIRNAKISLELQDAPPVLYTDSEGIFSFPLKNFSSQVRIRVEVDGYEKFDRLVTPSSNSGIEEIQLISIPTEESVEKFTIVGTWLVFDPGITNPLSSIILSQKKEYQGGNWGSDFGGSNGLGAYGYRFDEEVLSFNGPNPNQLVPVDESYRDGPPRLIGNVKVIKSTEIEFTVTGGYYGTGQNLGKVFRLRK
jgi:hypothetical protein